MTQTAVKERGIIFSADIVKAILEGRKTQTRRVIKPQPEGAEYWTPYNFPSQAFYPNTVTANPKILKCPYGQAGDRLWVKETWAADKLYDDLKPRDIPWVSRICYFRGGTGEEWDWIGKTRSSRFMPRWASRTLLEITELRVERLQGITEEDAIREGISAEERPLDAPPAMRFATLWDSIHDKTISFNAPLDYETYPWYKNPWVWVIGFRLV